MYKNEQNKVIISKTEVKLGKQLIASNEWYLFVEYAKIAIDNLRKRRYVGETEFETIKKVLITEGKIMGITQLIKDFEAYVKNTQSSDTTG